MINPQPVYGKNSPYSSQGNNFSSQPPQNRPQPPLAPKPSRPSWSWKKKIGAAVLVLFVGAAAYAAAAYTSLKKNIIVADENTKNAAILNYDPNNEASLNTSDYTHIGDGRFNIILIGIDKAASLTDSIQVISIDTINKQATSTSIPRDLYVTVPGYGKTKINAAYRIAEDRKAGSGSAMVKDLVGSILGTTITNYALTDFSGLESLVDSIGGIDVYVTEAINDPFFPAATGDGYAPFSIKAGQQHLDGKTALRYARSRKTTSDFDRARRQADEIVAIRKKILSLGVLSNPVKINGILQALGKSFKTDVTVDQMKTLLGFYQNIPDGQNKGYVLDTSSELDLLTSSSNTAAGYIAFPIAGTDNYTDIQRWFRKNNPDPLLAHEKPTITIANGGKATTKQMNDLSALLKDFGYQVVIDTTYTSKSKLSATEIYATHANQKPITQNYIAHQFNVSLKTGSPLKSTSDFELIYVPTTTTASVATTPKATTTPRPTPKPSPTAKVTPTPSPSPSENSTVTPDDSESSPTPLP